MGEAKKPATVMSHIVLFDKEFILSIWGNDECEFLEVDAAGSVGGLLTVWNPKNFKLLQQKAHSGERWMIHCCLLVYLSPH